MIVSNTSLRASFRFMEVLENAVLRPWHQQKLLTWVIGILFNILALWKDIIGILWYNPQGHLQAQGGVEIWSVEALTSTVLKLLAWILGILFNILALWIEIIGILWYHLQGQLQAESVAKCSSEALSINSLKLLTWILGYFVKFTCPLKRHCWYRLTSPSGLASGLRRCCKMESPGCGIQSFSSYWI